MPKKKFDFFDVGDLLKLKERVEAFQRTADGVKGTEQKIKEGNKVIFLGAKVCPGDPGFWALSDIPKGEYIKVRPATIKIMHDGAVWYFKVHKNRVYKVLKLVQRVHK